MTTVEGTTRKGPDLAVTTAVVEDDTDEDEEPSERAEPPASPRSTSRQDWCFFRADDDVQGNTNLSKKPSSSLFSK
jgi:hypothetical protein